MKTVFVTVGTTRFDESIESVTSSEVTQVSKARGYTRSVLQVGSGSFLPDADSCAPLSVEAFRFKDSIAADMRQADSVISHAGAGSCSEALGAGKPSSVVVNDKSMDNHQSESARQSYTDRHSSYCSCSNSTETSKSMDLSVSQPFPPGQPKNFANFLDKAMGSK